MLSNPVGSACLSLTSLFSVVAHQLFLYSPTTLLIPPGYLTGSASVPANCPSWVSNTVGEFLTTSVVAPITPRAMAALMSASIAFCNSCRLFPLKRFISILHAQQTPQSYPATRPIRFNLSYSVDRLLSDYLIIH